MAKKVGKVAFDGARNGAGVFEEVPTGFDYALHKKLIKDDFDNLSTFWRWVAHSLRSKAAVSLTEAEGFDGKAEARDNRVDPATKRRETRLEKLRSQLHEHETKMIEDGELDESARTNVAIKEA